MKRRPLLSHLLLGLLAGGAGVAPTGVLAASNTPRAPRKPTPRPKADRARRQRHATAAARTAPLTYAGRDDAMRFADELAQRRGWDLAWVQRHIGRARQLETVQRLIMPPPAGTAKNWAAYRARFIEPSRIQAGVQFWEANASWLQRAQERFGVPPGIVLGILGVETFFGRIMGDFRVIDALATLAFDFPPGRRDRSAFFREELEALLDLAQRQGTSPEVPVGSFAGAMGLPQFMPSSINRYAIDFDDDGRIDLDRSAADVIGSVANYLATFGWQRDMPTHHAVEAPVDTTERARLLVPDIVPSFSAAQMTAAGARLAAAALTHEGPLALVELQNGDAAPSYVAGTQNFYVVTRYNWSSYYALAVIELGEAITRARAGR